MIVRHVYVSNLLRLSLSGNICLTPKTLTKYGNVTMNDIIETSRFNNQE